MKGYVEAIKLNLESKTLTKKFLAGGVTDEEPFDIAHDVYSLKIRSQVPSPSPKAGRRSSTLPRATILKFVFHAMQLIFILDPACKSCRFLPAADNYVYRRLPHPFHSF
jgi:hypothetical protein